MSDITDKINAFADEWQKEQEGRNRRADWRCKLHIADKLGVDEKDISDMDVHLFVSRMGAEYLRRKVNGIGVTIAAKLVKEAQEGLK